jgi:rhamnulose-1-phosphate aldolase
MAKTSGSQNGFKSLVDEVRKLGDHLWRKGWAEKNAGNLSVNVTDLFPKAKASKARFIPRTVAQKDLAGDCFLVTATGARFRDVAEDPERWAAVLRVSPDLKGFQILWGGRGGSGSSKGITIWAPTSELPSHLKIHSLLKRSGGRDKAVLHTHPTELVAMSHLPDLPREKGFTELLWSMIPEVKMYTPGGAGLAPYGTPGTEQLADETVKVLKTGAECVVWEMHGTLSVGPGPMEAFDVVDVLNKAAQVYLAVRGADTKPKGLNGTQLAEIEKNFQPPPPRA